MACSSASTTLRICGTTDTSRNTRRMRSARSTERLPVAGMSVMEMTAKSNRFQPRLKKAGPCASSRAASSTTKTATMALSSQPSQGDSASFIVAEVSRPSVTALTTISTVTSRSVFGEHTKSFNGSRQTAIAASPAGPKGPMVKAGGGAQAVAATAACGYPARSWPPSFLPCSRRSRCRQSSLSPR